jgi:hypothetical protein
MFSRLLYGPMPHVKQGSGNMLLVVHQFDEEDDLCDSDSLRVNFRHRKGIKRGQVCKVTTNGNWILAAARNTNDTRGIWLNDAQRDALNVKTGDEAEFEITKVSWYRGFVWMWTVTEPMDRLAAQLGILSFGLGVVSLVLGAWSVYLVFRPPV